MRFIQHTLSFLTLTLTIFFPVTFVWAEDGVALARSFVAKINQAIVYPLIILMMGVAMVYFLYGAFEYVMNADNESGRETGKKHLLWGVVGLVVMVSAYALLEIAANTFNVSGELQKRAFNSPHKKPVQSETGRAVFGVGASRDALPVT